MPLIDLPRGIIEYQWYHPAARCARDPVILLHEGLGSVSLWKDFPASLAQASGRAVLAYSRYGNGQSAPLRAPRQPGYLHDEALEVLPLLRERLAITSCALLGHSDGASIALIHAGARRWPVSRAIVMAPHVFVEDLSLESIAQAREAYATTDMKARLSRHHADPDSAFWSWCNIWLDARFRDWNIEEFLPAIEAPVLAIQGYDDEYGSMEQIHRLVRTVEMIEVLKLEDCGHSPHRDQPEKVLGAVTAFLDEES